MRWGPGTAAKSSARTVTENSSEGGVNDEPRNEIEHRELGRTRSRGFRSKFLCQPLRHRRELGRALGLYILGLFGIHPRNPVDPSLARESLKIALDHWKKGENPKSLESSATPIVAKDYEWDSGAKLLDYQILDERGEDANLRIQVKLTLGSQGKSKTVEKKASYVVGTSPTVTVFRDIMRR